MPSILLSDGLTMTFDRDWLARALGMAAARAGFADWWLAAHVARAVQLWLEQLSETTNNITTGQLTRAVRGALQAMGYGEIGERFEAAGLFSRISLADIARSAGDGFELEFFRILEARLREVMGFGGSYCELHGMRACVKTLRRKKAWNQDCDKLREEIVAFVRQRTRETRAAAAPVRGDFLLYVT